MQLESCHAWICNDLHYAAITTQISSHAGSTPMRKRARAAIREEPGQASLGAAAAAASTNPSSLSSWEDSRHQDELREKERQHRLAEAKWSSEKRELVPSWPGPLSD